MSHAPLVTLTSFPNLQYKSPMVTEQHGFDQLPAAMRLLYVCEQAANANWLANCLSADSSIKAAVQERKVDDALILLREQSFDALLLELELGSDHPVSSVVPAIRAGSRDDLPVLVLGDAPSGEMTSICREASADAYLCRRDTSVRTLLWQIDKARERHRLIGDNRKLRHEQQRSRRQQQQEAFQQLRDQRCLLTDSAGQMDPDPPGWLVDHFRDLVRIHVVAGCGNLQEEVSQLVERLASCQVTLREALLAHTVAVERLVAGQGNRGTWHIIGRGNLLAYELVLQMSQHCSAFQS